MNENTEEVNAVAALGLQQPRSVIRRAQVIILLFTL